MKKAVMFDLDGTLIHSLPDIARSMNTVLEKNGLPPHSEEAYKLFTGDGAMNLTKRAVGEAAPHLVDTVYQQYREEYALHSRELTAPYAGIQAALDELKNGGYLLMVLSNKDDADARDVVAHYFPDTAFALVQGRMDGYLVKPDPALALHMLNSLGLQRTDLWYVGDTITDMRCARNIGATSIAVTWGFQTRDMLQSVQPDYFAKDPGEMVRIILDNK